MNDGSASTFEIVGLAISTITALGVLGGFVVFWMSVATKISEARSAGDKAQSAAENALQEGVEAHKSASLAHDRITVQSESFGLYRERVAKEYVSRDILREMEERLTSAIRDSSRTASEAITSLGVRLDKAINSKAE